MEERYGNYVILKTDINENKSLFLIPLMVLLISILLVTTYTIKRSMRLKSLKLAGLKVL